MASQDEEALVGRLMDVATIKKFMLAGNATLTLRSPKTGTRFTYKVRRGTDFGGKPKDFWFCSLLTGQDNDSDYQYFGHFFIGRNFRGPELIYQHGRKSRISQDALSMKAWGYFAEIFRDHDPSWQADRLATIEVWHEGRCG
ncbi:hypothetical protein, partial [Parvimonas sp. M20]